MLRRLLIIALLSSAPVSTQVTLLGGPSLPPTCIPGQIFVVTGTISESFCTATNVWTTAPIDAALVATSAQGAKADSALQPAGNGSALTGLTKTQVGLANVDNTSDANKPVSSATQTALNGKISTGGLAGTATALATPRAINGVNFDGTAPITVTAAGSTLSDNVTYARGGIGACAATSATTGTMTVSMTTPCVTITPTGAATFNASGGVAGQILVFSITTSGSSSFTLTWGTNFRKTGTLATGVTTARFFTVTFLCLDGTIWTEIARTAVQS